MEIRVASGNEKSNEHAQLLSGMIDGEAKRNKMLAWDAVTLEASIEQGHSLLAFENGRLVGHICLFPWKNYVEICALIVDSERRHCGIGTALLRKSLELSEELFGHKPVIILPNEDSFPLSRKAGFEEKQKLYFEGEIWESCVLCREHKKFPNCHCKPMILRNHNQLEIASFGLQDVGLIGKTAELYCQIWKESPWNENFWKKNSVVEDILSQMHKRSALFLAAVSGEEVVGFTWGYEMEKEEMRSVSGSGILDCIFSKNPSCFYIDELATASGFRDKGIGKRLALFLLGEARAAGQKSFVLRTDVRAYAARKLYADAGFRDLGLRDVNYLDRTYWLRD